MSALSSQFDREEWETACFSKDDVERLYRGWVPSAKRCVARKFGRGSSHVDTLPFDAIRRAWASYKETYVGDLKAVANKILNNLIIDENRDRILARDKIARLVTFHNSKKSDSSNFLTTSIQEEIEEILYLCRAENHKTQEAIRAVIATEGDLKAAAIRLFWNQEGTPSPTQITRMRNCLTHRLRRFRHRVKSCGF